MFNSFGRNDPVTRRDVPAPVLGSANPSTTRNAAGNLASAQAPRSPNPVSQTKATENPSVDQGVRSAATPASAAAAVESESATGEKVIGARLIVGPDVKLKGAEILDCDTLVVEGRVEATMDSRVIRIAEKGSFSGKVSIDIAEIHGTFEGELTARSQLIIHATGRVSGSIRFGKLVVDEGGELCGEINVLSENVTAKARPVVEPLIARNVASA
jgi:cytoskeletal protein CcmA (bactofilin family)